MTSESKKSKAESQTIMRRNTEKLSKLPVIQSMKDQSDSKDGSRKFIASRRGELSKLSKKETEDENSKQSEAAILEERDIVQNHELSQKAIRKIRLREISVNKKKSGQVRETLVPKTIQFEGNRLDGLSDYSKQEQNRANE